MSSEFMNRLRVAAMRIRQPVLLLQRRQLISRLFVCGLMLAVSFPETGCNQPVKKEEQKGKVLARVHAYQLYEADLAKAIPAGLTSDDSARRSQSFINSWVKEMLLVDKSEKNLGDAQKNMDQQLRDYRNSLIIYTYEKELVRQKLDTVVTDEMIEQYYLDHQNDFELKDNIVKVIYVKVNKKAPNQKKLPALIQSDKPQDRIELENYCRQFAANYFLDDEVWLLFDDLLKEVPIVTYNKELFLQNNRFVSFADTGNVYFMNIKGFMTRNSQSPLAFEKENIRNIILNQRKRELIERMHTDIYKEAMENKDIEIYVK
ncbi:MAG TPA: hypothetical protein VI731_01125 [Bacteroidia bacterium]|nr:hypothetical protein [Bacteroidia bacterium]